MRNSKTIILVLLFLKTLTINAQEIKITGLVNDGVSHLVLQDAVVTLKSLDSFHFSKTVITDKDGMYKLSLPRSGFYTLEATFLGYIAHVHDTLPFNENQLTAPPILLLPNHADLQTVTITTKKPFIVMGTNKITLNVAQSPIAAGSNAYDVIKKAPGIVEQNNDLNFRGKSTRILINGRPSNLSGEDLKTMLTNMQANNIEKVEILPNPSAKYDAQGGSVINIILAKNKLYGTNYVLTTGIGTGKYVRGNTGLDVNYRNKNMNLYGGYTYEHNQQYYLTNSTRYLPQSQLKANELDLRKRYNNGYKLGLDYDISDKNSFGVLVNGYVNDRDRKVNNTAILHYDKNILDSSSTVNTAGRAIISSPSLNIYYKTRLDTTGKELTLNADYMYYGKQWKDDFTNQYNDAKGQQYLQPDYLKDNSPAKIKVYSLTADYVQPTKKGALEMGVKTSYTITDNDVFWQSNSGTGWLTDKGKTNHFIYKENVNAVYGNYTAAVKKWNVVTGLRMEQTNTTSNSITTNQVNKNSYVDFFPNINVGYTKNENNVFGLSYRKSINRFGFDVVNPFIIYENKYAYSQGNPNIKPEIYHTAEVSYTYKQAYSITLDYMHGVKTLGEIYLSGTNNVTISSYANYNNSDIFYLSFSANKSLTKKWDISFNPMYGYISLKKGVENISKGTDKKKWVSQISCNNTFSFTKGWVAELAAMYVGPFQYGSYSTKTMFSSDFGVSKSLLKNKGNLKVGVTDIFNTLNYNKDLNYAGIVTSLKNKPESRFLNITFKYKFGNKNVKDKNIRDSKLSDLKNRIQ